MTKKKKIFEITELQKQTMLKMVNGILLEFDFDKVHSYMDQLIKLLHGLKSMNPEPEDMEFDHLGLPRDLKGTASD